MKKILLLLMLSVSSHALADNLTEKERAFLLSKLPVMLEKQWDQPEITACYREGQAGDGRALKALYAIYKSISEIEKNTIATKEFLEKHTTSEGFNGKISDLLAGRDVESLQKIVKILPQAIQYCEGKMTKEEAIKYRENISR